MEDPIDRKDKYAIFRKQRKFNRFNKGTPARAQSTSKTFSFL